MQSHLLLPKAKFWDELLLPAYLSAQGSYPKAIYIFYLDVVQVRNEHIDCHWWTPLFWGFSCFWPVHSASGNLIVCRFVTCCLHHKSQSPPPQTISIPVPASILFFFGPYAIPHPPTRCPESLPSVHVPLIWIPVSRSGNVGTVGRRWQFCTHTSHFWFFIAHATEGFLVGDFLLKVK